MLNSMVEITERPTASVTPDAPTVTHRHG
jgi:hypothetical protein